jgi:hypothetical protein
MLLHKGASRHILGGFYSFREPLVKISTENTIDIGLRLGEHDANMVAESFHVLPILLKATSDLLPVMFGLGI